MDKIKDILHSDGNKFVPIFFILIFSLACVLFYFTEKPDKKHLGNMCEPNGWIYKDWVCLIRDGYRVYRCKHPEQVYMHRNRILNRRVIISEDYINNN